MLPVCLQVMAPTRRLATLADVISFGYSFYVWCDGPDDDCLTYFVFPVPPCSNLIIFVSQVSDIYKIEGLTATDKKLFKKYEDEFVVKPPNKRTFNERINARVST